VPVVGSKKRIMGCNLSRRVEPTRSDQTTQNDTNQNNQDIQPTKGGSKKYIANETPMRVSALRGDLNFDVHKLIPRFGLRIFVSSTFTDTHAERNIILDEILPELRASVNKNHIDISFIDMRYGVRDENTYDHLTWITCCTELTKCMNESAGMFFISLQGNKYGYRPIPKYLAKEAFDQVIVRLSGTGSASKDTIDLLQAWYILDENNVPPIYSLKSLASKEESDVYFGACLPELRCALRDINFTSGVDLQSGCSDLLVDRSVTDWEARFALQDTSNASRCLWMQRKFEGGVDSKADENHEFDDISGDNQTYYNDLITYMTTKLTVAGNRQSVISNGISLKHYLDSSSHQRRQYLTHFKEQLVRRLRAEIDSIVEKRFSWSLDGHGIGLDGGTLNEIFHHCKLAKQKCDQFIGRSTLIEQGIALLTKGGVKHHRAAHGKQSDFDGINLCIVGGSGCGKTSLMAKLADKLYTLDRRSVSEAASSQRVGCPVIVRFCGTSPFSLTGFRLIKSIILQIACIYQLSPVVPVSYEDAVNKFHMLISEYPVILLIDSLDQLSDEFFARSRLSFLKGIKPHKDSLIIISTLPDTRQSIGSMISIRNKISWYGCETILKAAAVPTLIVSEFKGSSLVEDSRSMFSAMLALRKRRLTPTQQAHVVASMPIEPTALYLNLLCDSVSQWKSSDPVSSLSTHGSVSALVNQLFEGLERTYGKVLVRSALGFITFSVMGVSDTEILDLLSLDERVCDSVFQYSRPERDRVPIHVWLRLRNALSAMLVHREANRVAWGHRQLQAVAEGRFSHDQEETTTLRRIMGLYYSDRVDPKLQSVRGITPQPLTLNGQSTWLPASNLNRSRFVESIPHLLASNMIDEALSDVCDLNWVCGCLRTGEGFNLVSWLLDLQAKLNLQPAANQESRELVNHYYRWLQADMAEIITYPITQLVATCIRNNPIVSKPRQQMISLLASEFTPPANKFTVGSCSNVAKAGENAKMVHVPITQADQSCWVRPRVLSNSRNKFDACLLSVGEPDGMSQGFAINRSCDRVIVKTSGGLRIWNTVSGLVQTGSIPGDWADASSLTFIDPLTNLSIKDDVSDGRLESNILVACKNELKVVDPVSGLALATLKGHLQPITCTTAKYGHIVSGSADKTIRLWTAHTGDLLMVFSGHNAPIISVDVNSDITRVLSGSSDMRIRVWSVKTGECIHFINVEDNKFDTVSATTTSLPAHSALMNCIFNPDASVIAAALNCGLIILYSANSAQRLQAINAHTTSCCSRVSFSPDGRRLLVAADQTIKVWEVSIGSGPSQSSFHLSASLSRTFFGHTDNVLEARMSVGTNTATAASRIVSVSESAIKVWDWDGESSGVAMPGVKKLVLSPTSSFTSAVNGGTSIAAIYDNKTVKLWDADKLEFGMLVSGFEFDVEFVCFDKSNNLLTASRNLIVVWNASTGKEKLRLPCKSSCIVFAVDGSKFLCVSENGKAIELRALPSGEIAKTFSTSTDEVTVTAVLSNDGTKLASISSDELVSIWSVATGNRLLKLLKPVGDVGCMAFDGSGNKIVTVNTANQLNVYHLSDYTKTVAVNDKTVAAPPPSQPAVLNPSFACSGNHMHAMTAVAFSACGTRIASAAKDSSIRVWSCVASSGPNDGSATATVNTNGVDNLIEVCRFYGHSGVISSLCFTEEAGKYSRLVSGGRDGSLLVWEARSALSPLRNAESVTNNNAIGSYSRGSSSSPGFFATSMIGLNRTPK
jgi:WD40 repeat protein